MKANSPVQTWSITRAFMEDGRKKFININYCGVFFSLNFYIDPNGNFKESYYSPISDCCHTHFHSESPFNSCSSCSRTIGSRMLYKKRTDLYWDALEVFNQKENSLVYFAEAEANDGLIKFVELYHDPFDAVMIADQIHELMVSISYRYHSTSTEEFLSFVESKYKS